MSKTKKRNKNAQRPARPSGWSTSDADEIERRQLRGLNEPSRIESQTQDDDFFGVYQVDSNNEQTYRVEIRSLAEPINSCDCPDHRINGLGTCKHIEATLNRLQYRRKRAFQNAAAKGSPYIEIFLDRRDHQIRIRWPEGGHRRSKARDLITPFFSDDNILAGNPLDTLPAMQRTINASHPAVRRRIRWSHELNTWLDTLDRHAQQIRSRQHFETEVAAGNANLDLVKHPLYPYQQEGMLHLAFTGRALLADEMGLGKTVQAIAACELLRRTSGIRRVLVISPASLKGEWEDQIDKFTSLPSSIIQGTRAKRLRQYEDPAFFSLASYEQMRSDVEEINTTLAPDVIILDEAQRIKNWQTKTAISIKRLKSPYAFVLTGTPIENRIDEIYSIVQFLDPHIFGPLFRFNRDFYKLDEKGRAIGYKNLDQLHKKLQPIMLRRRKEKVEGQLPGRTINTYFVPMHKEQVLRYGEYESRVARLAAIAKKRPLKKEEMEQLQLNLACMRMLCDTPYILDQDCRISPKLKELGNILQEIMADGDHKIIIFSEWERMLQLVREQAEEMGLGHAVHTGKIPQPKRRDEIRRFKDDPKCRLFLSTDSGSVGLNLQVADVVINLDMPWNPAKLEQRIARAWRKHQKRPVQVINLVSEGSIEHRMLSLLEQKRSLAEGVVDGKGKKEMDLPSGRAAFLERIDTLIAGESKEPQMPPTDPLDRLRDDILSQWSHHLELMELHGEGAQQTLLVVADRLSDALQSALTRQLQEQFPEQTPQLKLLNRDAFATIQQLINAGVLNTNQDAARTVYRAPTTDKPKDDEQSKRLTEARNRLAQSEHKRRMAKVLTEGGFSTEALVPMREAVEMALRALLFWRGHDTEKQSAQELIESKLVQANLLPAETLSLVTRLREDQPEVDEAQAGKLIKQSDDLLSQAASVLK
ncbi:MAG: DEAD/DEAH box helicase [gamma proteobacterium endosymbiont of Lamellibrachia anaximandri]|nr:DEAD/DEAH box helicase [gamma proteobacterium endosymbiont of Lamellibrachia anaximandri]MBL3535455.1 DEAD/DEAH box helicase [gamma proteobacterium endosymbiont of Lamellibrachia anaximandri]